MSKHVSIILSLVAAVLLVMCIIVFITEDRTAPHLLIPEAQISYVEGQNQSVLLTDVTAWDNRDGDLTENVRIYSIADLENGKEALVTYAVYDEAANMTKKTRVVNYKKAVNE